MTDGGGSIDIVNTAAKAPSTRMMSPEKGFVQNELLDP
jgi:hypothetical protein